MELDSYIERVNAGEFAGDLVRGMSPPDAARVMYAVGKEAERLGVIKAKFSTAYDHLRRTVVPEMMGDIRNMTVEDLGRVTLRSDAFVSVAAEDRPKLEQWLADTGLEDVITQTVNASALKALAIRMVKEGKLLPEFIKFTPFTQASVTKA